MHAIFTVSVNIAAGMLSHFLFCMFLIGKGVRLDIEFMVFQEGQLHNLFDFLVQHFDLKCVIKMRN